ncbi:MAG: hypothetical protein AB1714_27740 [Acidobacteriota bacterium]
MNRLTTELVRGGVTVLKGYEADDPVWASFGVGPESGALVSVLRDPAGGSPAMLIVVQLGTWRFEQKTDYEIAFSILPAEFPEMPR